MIQSGLNNSFHRLQIHLGGIDNFIPAGKRINVRRNFTGCMENAWFNHMNIIKDVRMNQPRFKLHGAVMLGMCQVR